MSKHLFIAEKPSVAREFARVLGVDGNARNGYLESADTIVTWCVGHLITMSYPEAYDAGLKRWSVDTLPFLPETFKYEVIDATKAQFEIIRGLLNRPDVDTIYVCTDSGREGEYIYRLVEQEAHVTGKIRKRVWIDSQTEEEIRRGIKEARDLSEYDNLSASAYLRAQEDYLMGINFSRILSLKFGPVVASFLNQKYAVLSVGRVMTCVQGMVVRREREIRDFVKTPFYRVTGRFSLQDSSFDGEWKAVKESRYFESPLLYKENGFQKKQSAEKLITELKQPSPLDAKAAQGELSAENGRYYFLTEKIEKKKEKKNPPLLFNLAELQNECSKRFHISPDETLRTVQELYEKKLVTYPRTDARVLSTAVSKEITKNIGGLRSYRPVRTFAETILEQKSYVGLAKTRYVNDKQITDHYAIVPTGQGFGALRSCSSRSAAVYDVIVRRFLSIFYPAAEYEKYSLTFARPLDEPVTERLFAGFRVLTKKGYLEVAGQTFSQSAQPSEKKDADGKEEDTDASGNPGLQKAVQSLKKGQLVPVTSFEIKEGETSPPKRYTSGSLILAMENAGQLIEDEDLRAQIKGSGIGTSATRAEILKKLVTNKYLALNSKTQVVTPTHLGEMIYDVVDASMRQLLNPELTASWEKGLSYVQEGTVTPAEYRQKLDNFVTRRTLGVRGIQRPEYIRHKFVETAPFYTKASTSRQKKAES